MKVLFYTQGCKVNQYETQAMRRIMEEQGFETGEYGLDAIKEESFVIVINSCTVTGESDRKLRQFLRRVRRHHPGSVIVLTGCMPQAFPDTAKSYAQADIVIGNSSRSSLPETIKRYLTERRRIFEIKSHENRFEPLTVDSFQGRTRAFVKIEDGCDRYCSYCIIPYARGHVRSKPLTEIVGELESLANKGFLEVVLVGINLTSYGREWGGSIYDAVKAACSVPGISRVRLGSIEPYSMTPEVIEKLSSFDKICPQFHLSLQSGCAATLRRMNRHYTPSEYLRVCEELRKHFRDCALTTDVMVGFPGEDQDEFNQSLSFVKSVGFSHVHIFAYSRRPGTPAAKAQNQVSGAEKARRSQIMADVCRETRDAYLDGWVGRETEVLIESHDGGGAEGYSPQYFPVNIDSPSDDCLPGRIVKARITGHRDGICSGIHTKKPPV